MLFVELININGDKVFVRPKEIRCAKVEKMESSYYGYFLIDNEDFYSTEAFDTAEDAENFIKHVLIAKDEGGNNL